MGRGGQVVGNAGNTEDTAQRVGGVRSNMKGELVHSRGKKAAKENVRLRMGRHCDTWRLVLQAISYRHCISTILY